MKHAFLVATLVLAATAGPVHASSAGRCGGTGGGSTKTLTCPAGQYIVGIGARAGLVIDEFSIACQKIPVSGAAGSRGGFKSGGPGGGVVSRSAFCKQGQAVTSITTHSGGFVDKVHSGACQSRDGDGWKSGNSGVSFAELDLGGPGGGFCQLACPQGEAMFKITVKFGGVVDSLRGECRK
ncbi:MAG: hypothetical protein WAT70_11500 [Rhizobiaceae bacterium]